MFAAHWSSTPGEELLGQGEFHCPQCRTVRRYAHIRAILKRFWLIVCIPLWRTDTVGEYVRCLECGLDFGIDVLGDPARPPIRHMTGENTSLPHLRKVIELSENAAVEICRRMAGGNFGPAVGVRVIPHKAGAGCDIKFDDPYTDGRDWIGRSQNLSVLIDKDDATILEGAVVDFRNGMFLISQGGS